MSTTDEKPLQRVPDPLGRWTSLPLEQRYRMSSSEALPVVSLRTNSRFLVEAITSGRILQPYDGEKRASFRWEIVVEQELEEEANEDSKEKTPVSVARIDSSCAVYFGSRSFFAINLELRYGSGFLSLSGDLSKRVKLTERYIAYLAGYTIDAMTEKASEEERAGVL